MGNLNIFQTIKDVTSRYEPFHSRFLADALSDSLTGNRTLFDAFWRLSAPEDWDVPARAEVTPEHVLERGRIDICIRSTSPDRVLGIEVKTTDSSATDGQLKRYWEDLKKQHTSGTVAIAYLTPFNRVRAGEEFATQLKTVEEHDKFSSEFPNSRHVSWLDVADITWEDNNALWQQHRVFVKSEISCRKKLRIRSKRDRSFNVFFGDAAADAFWEKLAAVGIESSPDAGTQVSLAEVNDVRTFVDAFEALVSDGEGISRQRKRPDQFPRRDEFVKSPLGNIHEALFKLTRHEFVWIEGQKNYGVRVAHDNHPSSGVSLVRSLDEKHLLIGQLR